MGQIARSPFSCRLVWFWTLALCVQIHANAPTLSYINTNAQCLHLDQKGHINLIKFYFFCLALSASSITLHKPMCTHENYTQKQNALDSCVWALMKCTVYSVFVLLLCRNKQASPHLLTQWISRPPLNWKAWVGHYILCRRQERMMWIHILCSKWWLRCLD